MSEHVRLFVINGQPGSSSGIKDNDKRMYTEVQQLTTVYSNNTTQHDISFGLII